MIILQYVIKFLSSSPMGGFIAPLLPMFLTQIPEKAKFDLDTIVAIILDNFANSKNEELGNRVRLILEGLGLTKEQADTLAKEIRSHYANLIN